jgi:hypothetical protein
MSPLLAAQADTAEGSTTCLAASRSALLPSTTKGKSLGLEMSAAEMKALRHCSSFWKEVASDTSYTSTQASAPR